MRHITHAQRVVSILVLLSVLSCPGWAEPDLQIYIPGSVAGSVGQDEDTWISTSNAFNLDIIATLRGSTLLHGTLVASVPQGETGTLAVNGMSPLTTTIVTDQSNNPNGNADVDVLTNVGGNDAYSTKAALPDAFNNHYPFQNNVADFILYDVGTFSGNADAVSDFDAATGLITPSAEGGQVKTFTVAVGGFSWVHFDVYGYRLNPQSNETWITNPAGHDAAFHTTAPTPSPVIPAPGALLLAAVGGGLVSWLRGRKML